MRNRKHRYKCRECGSCFGGRKSSERKWVAGAYEQYTQKRQTLRNLSETYGKSRKTIRRYFDRHTPVTGEIRIPEKPVPVVLDATFFRRTEGILVARALSRNLLWREIETESVREYDLLLEDLKNAGIQFSAFTIDGRRGVLQLLKWRFPGIPVQICQFHQSQIVTRYLSRNPKLKAGKELRRIVLLLSRVRREEFGRKLDSWHTKWQEFLKEKTQDTIKGRWYYTHRRIRSAYRSLKTNLPFLFIFQDHPELGIPNTTNSCDGSFAHWKNKVKIHRGLASCRKQKMIHFFLQNS